MKTELTLLAKDIDWARLEPCGDCPFLRTSPYHEGVAASLPDYVRSIQDGNFAHTCHKTDNRAAVDGPRTWSGGRAQHCAGAVLMLLKTGGGMDLQLPLLEAAERGDLDIHAATRKAKQSPEVFTVLELLKFYGRELEKRLRTPAARAARRRQERKAARRRR